PATLPLVALLFQWRRGVHGLERYAVAGAAWLALTVSAFGLNAAITDKQMHFWSSSLAVYDLVGTIAKTDHALPDAELERTLAGTGLLVHDDIQAKARALFNPRDFLPIISDEQRRFWDLPAYGTTPVPEATREAIGRAWADVLTSHPGAYLRYRAAVMAEVLSLTHPRPSGVVPRRDFKVPAFAWAQGVPTRTSPAQHRLTSWMSSLWKVAPIFVPWMYVILAITIAILAIARRGRRDILALCASGLAMEASLCVLAMSPDYRYSHWLVVTTCLAIVLTIARRATRSTATAPA
ncbi:MAG: hypothetical protein H7138_27705, partial [Myxococcales bacterium]|nr:hypothetical protein [Myxococcales bacterium]